METNGPGFDRLSDLIVCGDDDSWEWSLFLWTKAFNDLYK